MKKLLSYLSIVLCSVLAFSSCNKEEFSENKLLGTWKWVSTITYNSDGSVEVEYADKYNGYSLTITEDVIFEGSEDNPKITYTFDGNTIYLLGGMIVWEVEELTNEKMRVKQSDVYDKESYSISEFKKK